MRARSFVPGRLPPRAVCICVEVEKQRQVPNDARRRKERRGLSGEGVRARDDAGDDEEGAGEARAESSNSAATKTEQKAMLLVGNGRLAWMSEHAGKGADGRKRLENRNC
eukprot:4773990-Pleurochrysis_carterae.AAC.1